MVKEKSFLDVKKPKQQKSKISELCFLLRKNQKIYKVV